MLFDFGVEDYREGVDGGGVDAGGGGAAVEGGEEGVGSGGI